METMIKIEGLKKKFGEFTAVDGLNFDIFRNEIFGLLGPNGAGKTTTINMLSTLLPVTSGTAEVAGFNVTKNKDEVRKSIGIVFQDPALDINLTGRENLQFHGLIYEMSKTERDQRIKEVLDLVELADKANVLVENYSGGMKRRLEISRGLMHRPKVLFLDEPTLGLDTQTRHHIWDYIKKLNKESKITIILTTHYMEEADFLCDRIAIIDHGKIMALDTPQNLKDVLGGNVVCLEFEEEEKDFMEHLKKLAWVKTMKIHEGQLCLSMKNGEKRIPELLNIAQKIKFKITSVSLHKPSLEDVFLHFTGKTIREQEADNNEKNKYNPMRRRH